MFCVSLEVDSPRVEGGIPVQELATTAKKNQLPDPILEAAP